MVTQSTPDVDFFGNCRKFLPMTDEELAKVIGQNVRAARVKAGLTQAELSARTGIAVPHVSRLEAGTHLPSVSTLKRVSDTLEVPICTLLDPPTGQREERPTGKGKKPGPKVG